MIISTFLSYAMPFYTVPVKTGVTIGAEISKKEKSYPLLMVSHDNMTNQILSSRKVFYHILANGGTKEIHALIQRKFMLLYKPMISIFTI